MAGKLVVAIVSFDSAHVLERCIVSLRSSVSAYELDIIVVDNGSSDESIELCARLGARVIPNGENLGYAKAVNRVMGELGCAEFLLVANPDVYFPRHSVDSLLTAMNNGSGYAAIGPRFVNGDGSDSRVPNGRRVIGRNAFWCHLLFARFLRLHRNPWTRRYHGNPAVRREPDWLSGACLLVRAAAFQDVNGFDERYFLFFEDVVLGIRMREKGYKLLYDPEVSVEHVSGMSTRNVSTWRHHVRSARQFYSSDYSVHRQVKRREKNERRQG